jgi:mannopine transport system ATP-binding protein
MLSKGDDSPGGRIKGAAITIHRVTKAYGSVTAVSDVSLDVRAGEFLSVLGRSGSGKTTLLMMIAGFEAPGAGTIHLGDRNITYIAPNRREIGMVFQRYALFPHMTVAQNISFPLRMRKTPKAEIARRIEAALDLVQLQGFAGRMPHQLSGGEQQRVAVARAIVFEPPVLLMDEPLGALDKKLREQMQIEIKRIQRRLGVTVVYVTHDQEEALTMSDRVVVMDSGQFAQIGTPMELYQHPDTPFVANFIGKMNFLHGEYLGTDGARAYIRLADDTKLVGPRSLNGSAALLRAGRGVRIAIRPERIALERGGQGGPNAIPGTVEAAIFVGSFQVFLVRAGIQDSLLQVQIPAGGTTGPFMQGDKVDLVAEPDAIHLFPVAEA